MQTAAIILAAGGSSRLGQPKQLVRLFGETLVRRAARVALESGCEPVVVVVGDQHDAIRNELSDLNVDIATNAQWCDGLGSSIAIAMKHICASEAENVILLACDQPEITSTVLTDLMRLRLTSDKPIVASAYSDTLGIPALFDRSFFGELAQLTGDHGAKRIILAHRDSVAEFPFGAGAIDIDTPADVERLQ